MAKPRRVSALSSVLKETQQYNKVAQEDEQVLSSPVEQDPVNTEKQISVDIDKPPVIPTEIQKSVSADNHLPVSTETQLLINTETQKSVNPPMQKARNTESNERTHKQTIVISEDLALRLKVHAAKRKETIASIATRAFEKILAEEESI
jgi:hypothetical protein